MALSLQGAYTALVTPFQRRVKGARYHVGLERAYVPALQTKHDFSCALPGRMAHQGQVVDPGAGRSRQRCHARAPVIVPDRVLQGWSKV